MFALFAMLSVVDGYPQYALVGFAGMVPFVLLAAVRAILMLRGEPDN